MLYFGITVFGLYSLLTWFDELYFHRNRAVSARERTIRAVNTFLIVGALTLMAFTHNNALTSLCLNIILILSFLGWPLGELDGHAQVPTQERCLHSAMSMFHPIMLVTLAAVYRFIDGAGLFMKIVLPFSTKHMRPLCYGTLAAMSLLFVVQLISNKLKRASSKEDDRMEIAA
jgi:hypothetical protein